jgi:hypothetical protein
LHPVFFAIVQGYTAYDSLNCGVNFLVVKVTVHPQLAPLIQELQKLWDAGKHEAIQEGLAQLIANLQEDVSVLASYGGKPDLEEYAGEDYVKSWGEILNVQVYVDTQIYGDRGLDEGGTVIQPEQGTDTYLQSWAEVAKEMEGLPNNLFTKLWTTVDIAKILDCSPAMLRRARKEQQLPLRVKEFMLDCVSHDGKRSLWFVRPA